jgi:hypothetical protein
MNTSKQQTLTRRLKMSGVKGMCRTGCKKSIWALKPNEDSYIYLCSANANNSVIESGKKYYMDKFEGTIFKTSLKKPEIN